MLESKLTGVAEFDTPSDGVNSARRSVLIYPSFHAGDLLKSLKLGHDECHCLKPRRPVFWDFSQFRARRNHLPIRIAQVLKYPRFVAIEPVRVDDQLRRQGSVFFAHSSAATSRVARRNIAAQATSCATGSDISSLDF